MPAPLGAAGRVSIRSGLPSLKRDIISKQLKVLMTHNLRSRETPRHRPSKDARVSTGPRGVRMTGRSAHMCTTKKLVSLQYVLSIISFSELNLIRLWNFSFVFSFTNSI